MSGPVRTFIEGAPQLGVTAPAQTTISTTAAVILTPNPAGGTFVETDITRGDPDWNQASDWGRG